jgi:hypothetical protein
MAVKPDPKPGRWILPLVILGMVAFTYFFVRELPAASPDTTLLAQETTTTQPLTADPTIPGNGTLDPATQAYVDKLDITNDALQVLGIEMITINNGFDADPREFEFGDAVTQLETLIASTDSLKVGLEALVVPEGLEINQQAFETAMQFATLAAGDALSGLQSTDTGELRRNAVEAYTRATEDFDTEITNAHNAAENAAA